jgi:hypothetical protein
MKHFSEDAEYINAECESCGRVLKIPRERCTITSEGLDVAPAVLCKCGISSGHISSVTSCYSHQKSTSAFSHNGTKIASHSATPAQKTITEWEHRDFVLEWNHKDAWYNTSHFTDARVRAEVWVNNQAYISSELQKFIDAGWQPIGQVGPSNIELRTYKELNGGKYILFALVSAGIGLLLPFLFYDTFIEPTKFCVHLRRHK